MTSPLTLFHRLDRYASAMDDRPVSASTLLRSSTASLSNAGPPSQAPPVSPPLTASPSAKTLHWIDSVSQPKMFPGLVRERARRSSVRQGSGSEKDLELRDEGNHNDGSSSSKYKPRSVPTGISEDVVHTAVLED